MSENGNENENKSNEERGQNGRFLPGGPGGPGRGKKTDVLDLDDEE